MLIFAQNAQMHKISTASVAGLVTQLNLQLVDKCFIQGIVYSWNHKINVAFEGLIAIITLFCREVELCWIYTFFVLICLAKKCASANCYAFCMSGWGEQPANEKLANSRNLSALLLTPKLIWQQCEDDMMMISLNTKISVTTIWWQYDDDLW